MVNLVLFLLQGHIWRTGFQSNELQGVVYEDVPEALKKWHAHGIKVILFCFTTIFNHYLTRIIVISNCCYY